MKKAMIAVMMLAVVRVEAAPPDVAVTDEIRDPRVISAMTRAWMATSNGIVQGLEAGFRLDATDGGYEVAAESNTREIRQVTMPIIRGTTIAIFHVHPLYSSPMPSQNDIRIANSYGVRVYVMHITGLYVYDPVSGKTTKLRDKVSWQKP